MAIVPKTPGLHHIALRCADFSTTKEFYSNVIGLQLVLESDEIIIFLVGNVALAFKLAAPIHPGETKFTPFNIGLDHIAIACETEEELKRFADGLAAAGVENTGVKTDPTLNKRYVAFKDPDKIQFEFYML